MEEPLPPPRAPSWREPELEVGLGAGVKIKEGLQVRDYNLLCLGRIRFAFSFFSIFAE
jgi:hypothetical protein